MIQKELTVLDKTSQAQHQDPLLKEIINKCQDESLNIWKGYKLKEDILYHICENQKDEKLVIPHNLRESILALYHNHELSTVHMATDKMIQLFKKRFIWPGMINDIKKNESVLVKNVLNINGTNQINTVISNY